VNLKERALLSLKTTFYTEPGMKARSCMTPFIDEAKHLLRIVRCDYQTFTILRIDFRRTQDLEELAACSPILALPYLLHLGNFTA
jgi:hypothetical protein